MVELAAGSAVDRYTVESVLGRGGMAVVYRVRHRQLGSHHALKLLMLSSPGVQGRLIVEGRAQSALHHPNIVTVTDVVEARGCPGLVLELVDGPSLDRFLAAVRPTFEQADHLAQGILKGVAAAHRMGIVHRDLKPGNVLLAIQDGEIVPKVTDFGLAKVLATDDPEGNRTGTGATLGTPAYMAPEQIRNAREVDARADVFALGAILYELVCGRRAFQGADTLSILNAVAEGRFTPARDLAPGLPDRMERAITGALQVDRDQRIGTVDALLELWRGDAPPVAAHLVWDRIAMDHAESLRSQPGAVSTHPPSEGGTWGPTLSHPEVPLLGPPPPGLSWRRTLSLFAMGTLGGIPFILGGLGLLFGDLVTPFREGGVLTGVLFIAAACVVGGLAVLVARERGAKPAVAAWILLPTALAALGLLGSLLGSRRALGFLEQMDPDARSIVAGFATSECIVAQLAGSAVSSTLYAAAALGLAWTAQPLVTRRGIPLAAGATLFLALFGGLGLWALHSRMSGAHSLAMTAPYVVYVVLAVCAAAAASLASDEPNPALLRPRVVVALLATFATAHASRALDSQHLMHVSRAFAQGQHLPGDIGPAETFIDSVGSLSLLPSVAWGALALCASLVPALQQLEWSGVRRPARAAAVAVVLLLPLKVNADREITQLARQILPGSVAAASRWQLGAALAEHGEVISVEAAPEGWPLVTGDEILAVEHLAFPSARALVHALWDCQCPAREDGPACALRDPCLPDDASIAVTVMREVAAGPSWTMDVVVPILRGAEPDLARLDPSLPLRKALEPAFFDFVAEPDAAESERGELREPASWDAALLKDVATSLYNSAKSPETAAQLGPVSDEWAVVLAQVRAAHLPDLAAAIPMVESGYRQEVQADDCRKGFWALAPEAAVRDGLAVRDCRFTDDASARYTPDSRSEPPVAAGRCRIPARRGCTVDERTDLELSTAAVVRQLSDAYADPALRDSGALVQLTVAAHRRPLEGLRAAVAAAGDAGSPRVLAQLDAETRTFVVEVLAAHLAAVCRFGALDDRVFQPWQRYRDGYCAVLP